MKLVEMLCSHGIGFIKAHQYQKDGTIKCANNYNILLHASQPVIASFYEAFLLEVGL